MVNGNWLYKAFIGGGVSATIALLGFIGSGVVENERRNVDEHKAIRLERTQIIGEMSATLTDLRIEQTSQRAILERIESKL